MASDPATIFVSYSHDSTQHKERVLALAERLRKDGVDAQLDQYVEGSPQEGWPRWMLNQLDWAERVLVVCTETYYRRFRGLERPEKGKGADWEGNLITLEIYEKRSQTTKFVPVFFGPEEKQFVPEPLRGQTFYLLSSEGSYAELYAFLTGQAGVKPGRLGPLVTLAHKVVEPLRFAVHNLPFPPNALFTGRSRELEKLSAELKSQRESSIAKTIERFRAIGLHPEHGVIIGKLFPRILHGELRLPYPAKPMNDDGDNVSDR